MLNRQYIKDKLNDLKYAAVTIKTKDENISTSIYGLLLGYRTLTSDSNSEHTKTDEPFVWIYKKKCVYLYSLKYYEIISIEIAIGSHGKTSQVSNFKEKQEEAVESILEIIKALKKQDKIQSNDLIDVYKYESLPIELKNDLEETKQTGIQQTRTPYVSDGNSIVDLYKNSNSYTPVYKPKSDETLFMERTSKYSIIEALKKMEEKIKRIKDGTYQPPKLKKLSADKEKSVEEDDDIDDVEDTGGYGYMSNL